MQTFFYSVYIYILSIFLFIHGYGNFIICNKSEESFDDYKYRIVKDLILYFGTITLMCKINLLILVR